MAIGERIHFFRLLRGMTQKYLGMSLGFPEKSADVRLAQYETGSRTPKADLTAALAVVVLRVMVAPAVVLLLRNLSGLQLGGLFPPGPEHFMQPGGVLVFATVHLQGKLTVLLRDFQPVVVLQGKQCVH